MSLFQKSVENKFLEGFDTHLIDRKYEQFQTYFANPEIQLNIRNAKEEQFQEGFLRELFVTVFEYTLNPQPNYNLTTEFKNVINNKKVDGAIIRDTEAIAVIELKGTDTTDLDSIETQAFGYKNHHPNCIYVITSNFEKLRFYIQNAVDYIDFNLFNLTREKFALMWLCLARQNLLSDLPKRIKESSVLQEENITKKLYSDYSQFRLSVFESLNKNNPDYDKLLLFKKTQKLLDRFLFIFFAEDRMLLPPNSISEIVNQWKTLKDELDAYVPLYDRFKKYFTYLNLGHKGARHDIFAYNGGLFSPDKILDSVSIDDTILEEHTLKLSQYDFETDVDVNILGHIFEHSLGEIESVQAEIKGELVDTQKSKRKKDGIFYTPKYITKYIVDNTLGRLCDRKRKSLGINDEDYAKVRKNQKKDILSELDQKLISYRDWLLSLTILDPACGSGAFLNQALDFLITEHEKIDTLRAQLFGEVLILSDITTDILEKNIYGVDLNEESVEIAKLSLWLRTAKKGRKLNRLNNNIKCGNSLIDDPQIAGEKAFNWAKEFQNIFVKKDKIAWHITTATHNSRYSQRMIDYHVKVGDAVWLTSEEERLIARTISDIVAADKLNIPAFNICGDHMHFVLVCEKEEVPRIVGKLKAVTAKVCNIAAGRTTRGHVPLSKHDEVENSAARGHAPLSKHDEVENSAARGHVPLSEYDEAEDTATRGHVPLSKHDEAEDTATRGHVPLSVTEKRIGTQSHLWTQKFGSKMIDSVEQLQSTMEYITNNRLKHELPADGELQKIIDGFICSIDDAFQPEYKGGFDVVIGNPPYVRAELLSDFREYLSANYLVYNPAGDLFSYFYEKSFKLLKNSGLFGFISNTFDKTTAGVALREYLQNEIRIVKYIDFTEVQIFEGATTYPVIILAEKEKSSDRFFEYIKIPKVSQSKVIDIDYHDIVSVNQNLLNKESWNLNSADALKLINKLKESKTIRELYGKSYRGILTGHNEAFIIPKAYSTGKHIKPIFEGREIEKWSMPESLQQLIIFESGWTKSKFGREISESGAIEKLKNEWPDLIARILPFEEKAKSRFDRGDFFWELRNCAYYDSFEKPKIVFPNLQNSGKFAYDETGSYINAPAVILPTGDKFLVSILNSKLIWYFLTNICAIRNGGYIEVKPQYFEQIPIPILNESQRIHLTDLTNELIANTKELQKFKIKFTKFLFSKYEELKTTKKLENWFKLDFKEFKNEISKQKIKFSISEESEWLEYFEEQLNKYYSIFTIISNLEKEVDHAIYKIYDLKAEEIRIVEDAVK